jgi:hypothetical protein
MTKGLSSSSGFEEVAMLVGLEFKPPCFILFLILEVIFLHEFLL